ncbi:MAG: M13 family metallopeptidase [Pyrinomonadaceae bacterium]
MRQPEFFKEMNRLATSLSIDDWKTYLRWYLLTTSAPRLSSAFADENFRFFNGVLQGSKEQLPRWRRCVAATDSAVGEALGEVYVKKAFSPESKARMQQLIKNLTLAYRDRLKSADWMTDATRQQALAKLEAFNQKIGYPEKWRDYTGLDLGRESFLDNALRATAFEAARNLRKIGKLVERNEWGMTPPTVNAYYSPSLNEIAFPAGILQPPFFNPQADDAINYGAIGAVIGHEITHGFDDQGSLYDAQGNLRMWWTPEDRANFDARAKCVIDQFSGYQVQENLSINGKLVAGESIADLGGLEGWRLKR